MRGKDFKWVYAYDRVCKKINELFNAMFVQKQWDIDERKVKILAKVNGETFELT